MPKISRSALISALVATVIFGSVPAAIRLIELDSIALGIVRLVLGTVGMGMFMTLQRRSSLGAFWAEVRREWWAISAMGLLFGLHWVTYFLSIKWSSASIGTLGFSTYGAQLPLLGWAFGFGRPSRAALVGAALALVGTWLCLPAVDWSTLWSSSDAIGLAIGVASGTSYAFLPLLHQRHSHMDHEIRTWAQFALALPVFIPLAPWATWSFTGLDLALMFYLGVIVTLFGHFLWVRATTELPIETTSILSYLQLPVTLAMNWLLLAAEHITLPMLTGAGLIVIANAVALGWRSKASEDLAEGQ